MPFTRAFTAPLVAAAALVAPASASALALEQVGSYERPTYVTSDPGDADRLFVVEQDGRVKLTEDGNTTPFLDIDSSVLSQGEEGAGTEQGLLSIAFSPGYATNDLFYVSYSGVDDPETADNESGDYHIDEFASDGDTADPTSGREVLTIEHRGANRHYGGQLQFGPDGYLYASTGDGSFAGDELGNAQNTENLLGSMLRIDPTGSSHGEYVVPDDNPFAIAPGCADGCDEIWSFGLRNPWRFSFDRLSGALVIGDVGQGRWEEVDFEPGPDPGRGDNFGWDCREGMHNYTGPDGPSPVCAARVGTFTEPAFEYPSQDPNCSITGGYVVRDRALGDLYGRYLYADFCAGQLRSLNLGLPTATGDRSEGLSVASVSSFGEDAACRIYVASVDGPVYRLTEPAASQAGCPEPIPNPPLPPPPPPPAGDGSFPPPDAASPDTSIALALDAKGKQKVKKLEVTVGCEAEACDVGLGGKAVAKKRGNGKRAMATGQTGTRTFAIRPKLISLAPGETETHRVRFKRKNGEAAVRTLRKLLKRKTYRKRTKAKLEVNATDTAGNTTVAYATVKLKR